MSQEQKFVRELDADIYRLLDSYRMLLKLNQVNSSTSVHEEHQMDVLSSSIVSVGFIAEKCGDSFIYYRSCILRIF